MTHDTSASASFSDCSSTAPSFAATTISSTSSSSSSSSPLSASPVFTKNSYRFRDNGADMMSSSVVPFLWEDKPGVAKKHSKAEVAAGSSAAAADRGSSSIELALPSASASAPSSSSSVSCCSFSASSSFTDMDELAANSSRMDRQQQHADNSHDHDVLGFFSARPLPPPPGRSVFNPLSRPYNSSSSSSASATTAISSSSSSLGVPAAAPDDRRSKVQLQPLHRPLIEKVLPPFNPLYNPTKKKISHVQAQLQDDPFWLAMVACTEEPFLPSQYQHHYTSTSNPTSSTIKSRHDGHQQKVKAAHKRADQFHQVHRRSDSLITSKTEKEDQHSSSGQSHGAPSPSIPQKQIKDAPNTVKPAIFGANRRFASAPEWIGCSPNPRLKHSHECAGHDHDDNIDAFQYRAALISKRSSNRSRAINHAEDQVQELPISTTNLSNRSLLYADKANCNRKSSKFFPDLLGCRSSSVVLPP